MKTLTRKPILGVERRPLFMERKSILLEGDFENQFKGLPKNPVKINLNTKRFENYTEEQKKKILIAAKYGKSVLNGVLKSFRQENNLDFTEEESEFLNTFVKYYEAKVRLTQNLFVYDAIPALKVRGRKAQNFKKFWKAYKLCKENGYDFRIFIDAQFEAFYNWSKVTQELVKFPRAQHLYSERAVSAYKNYMYDNEGAYEKQGFDHIKATPKILQFRKTPNVVNKHFQAINQSILTMTRFLNKVDPKLFKPLENFELSDSEVKLIKKFYAVDSLWFSQLDPAYLAMVPGFLDYYKKDRNNFVGAAKKTYEEVVKICEQPEVIKNIRAYAFNKEHQAGLEPYRVKIKISLLDSVDKALGWGNGVVDETWVESW